MKCKTLWIIAIVRFYVYFLYRGIPVQGSNASLYRWLRKTPHGRHSAFSPRSLVWQVDLILQPNPKKCSNLSPGEGFFNSDIFRSYTKLMGELCFCNNWIHIYRFFSFFTKFFWKECHLENVMENRLKDNKLIYFVHWWLHFADI